MYLTKHQTASGPRWALDGHFLTPGFTLDLWLELHRGNGVKLLEAALTGEAATGALLAPIEAMQEVWGCGVTYERSRDARQVESIVGDIYGHVYTAERPEVFLKAIGWRVVGTGMAVRIRRDARWNVPEPEMTLVANRHGEIVGFCAGNDMSSRDIEGENPLYLPQAKIYDGACALGPGILLADPAELTDLPVRLEILRPDASGASVPVFTGATRTSKIVRPLQLLVDYLMRETTFPQGAFLLTGTGVIPPEDFTLRLGDTVRISFGSLMLENEVQ
jgi:2-dehydro-3-deoxy-D-arabinonate dehydratase